jgi:DNA-binding HxlR family transcriptional regulator
MTLPRPGTPVRGSRSGRPIMALLDFLGKRWVLRIIWELRESSLTFRELRDRCDAMSPTVLNQRLRELREAGIVMLAESGGYTLSPSGRQLLEAMTPLQRWATTWHKKLPDQE